MGVWEQEGASFEYRIIWKGLMHEMTQISRLHSMCVLIFKILYNHSHQLSACL